MSALSIGRLAAAAEVKVPTIRFYEQIGLLPTPERTQSDRRVYSAEAVRRLGFIRHARQLGFSIDAIRALLALGDNPEQSCAEAATLAAQQLASVEGKIAQLEALRGELRRMVDLGCDGRVAQCRVIEALSDHSLCGESHVALAPAAAA